MWVPDFPGSLGPDPREELRAAWATAAAPQAMLAALRHESGRTPTSLHARALRAFAVRCARQRLDAQPAGDTEDFKDLLKNQGLTPGSGDTATGSGSSS